MYTTATIAADLTRGFDVMVGRHVVVHVDSYEEAVRLAAARRGLYVRYWAK